MGTSELQPGSEANLRWHDEHNEPTLREWLAKEEQDDQDYDFYDDDDYDEDEDEKDLDDNLNGDN